MVNFISNIDEYNRLKSRFEDLFYPIAFEQNPFKNKFRYYLAFEFDYIYHESFFEGLKRFVKWIGDKTICFYTLEPSAEDYFYHHFGVYSIFEISVSATDADLNEIMTKDPGDSPADSIDTNSNEIAWFSDSNHWAILGSRDFEIAVVGFTDLLIKEKFIESFSEDAQTMFTTVEQQALILDEILNFGIKAKEAYKKLSQKYRDR